MRAHHNSGFLQIKRFGTHFYSESLTCINQIRSNLQLVNIFCLILILHCSEIIKTSENVEANHLYIYT